MIKHVYNYLQPTAYTQSSISLYLSIFLCFFPLAHSLSLCLTFFYSLMITPQPNQTHKKQHMKYVNWAKKEKKRLYYHFAIGLSVVEVSNIWARFEDFRLPIFLRYHYVFYYTLIGFVVNIISYIFRHFRFSVLDFIIVFFLN